MPLTLAAVAAAVALAAPAGPAQERPVVWSLAPSVPPPAGWPAVERAGRFTVRLLARIDDGWHLYSTTQPPGGPNATSVDLPPGQPFRLGGRVRAPAPDTIPDRNFGILSEVYDDSTVLTVPVRVAADAPLEPALLVVTISYQSCTPRYCLPLRTDTLATDLAVIAASAAVTAEETPADPEPDRAAAATGDPGAPAAGPPAGPLADAAPPATIDAGGGSSGPALAPFLWLAITMGALALLTPCVFPMVPITVTSFLGAAGRGRPAALGTALLYAGGIVLTFTAFGFVVAVTFGATEINRFAANPWVNLAVAGLFVAYAAELLGMNRLAVPSAIIARLDAFARSRSLGHGTATLLTSAVFTLTAFTCTAPFVGSLLVMAARGSWQWPLLGMLAFSVVFAAPFFVLALLPGLGARLPRSGPWIRTLAVALALLELAAALKFLSNADLVWGWGVLRREVILGAWIVACLAIAAVAVAVPRTGSSLPGLRSPARLALAAVALLVAARLAVGMTGRRIGELEAFLPPLHAPAGALALGAAPGELPWIADDYGAALREARASGKPVLVDFTGYTCTNCRWMEANMFPRHDVRGALERFVRVRLYTDGRGERYAAQQRFQRDTFGTVALPLYAVVDSGGRPRATFLGMTRDPSEFVSFLERGAAVR